jgi:hypothetical protein
MSHSRFPSATSLGALALVAGAAVAGCGDDGESCGPGDAPSVGLIATGDGQTLTYGGLRAGLNGDCPASDAPSGVISLTILGTATDGFITLCVSRPDRLATQPQTLELDAPGMDAEVHLVDVHGVANNCSFDIDKSKPATGTLSASGMCGNGVDPAGFAVVVDGALSLTRTCGDTVDSIAVTLRGRVAVEPQ